MIVEHEFVNGVCRWCGGRSGTVLPDTLTFTCIARDGGHIIRSTPPSMFAGTMDEISERFRELQREYADRLANTTAVE